MASNTPQQIYRFASKACLLIAVICLAVFGFASRYRVCVDLQKIRCFPSHRVYLVDKRDKRMGLGRLYAFRSKGAEPIFTDGTKLIKRLVASSGDTVTIRPSSFQILVNGVVVSGGLDVAEKFGQQQEFFCGSAILSDGQHWFLGGSAGSVDSRYYGAVTMDQVIGRAIPIF